MQTMDEKQAFAQRLRQALKRSPKRIETATELAVQFSLRHPNAAITTQAAQKWLTGKSRPTPDKIETLAQWLDVPVLWLRHGVADDVRRPAGTTAARPARAVPPTAQELRLLQRLRDMPEARRRLVQDIIEQFALDDEMYRRDDV